MLDMDSEYTNLISYIEVELFAMYTVAGMNNRFIDCTTVSYSASQIKVLFLYMCNASFGMNARSYLK